MIYVVASSRQMPDRIRNDGRQSWLNLHSIDPADRKLQAEGKMSPLFPVNLDNQNCKR